jgi:putative addiction module killer protein
MIIVYTKYFEKWFKNLKDFSAKRKIIKRIEKLEQENYYGYCNYLKDGISELKFDFGHGYRIYFGEYKNKIVIILMGGDKSNQQDDIDKAKECFQKYLEEYSKFLNEEVKK